MKVEKDKNGDNLPLVIPTKEEFDDWRANNGFTSLMDLLEGYSILDQAHARANKELGDPEDLVTEVIGHAMDDIETEIYNLFVCSFRDFAAKEGGAK